MKNRELKKKKTVLCPVHHIKMKKTKIIWGYPAEVRDDLIYGGCEISVAVDWEIRYGESLDYGYICKQCLKEQGNIGQCHAYVLELGKVIPLNDVIGN